MIETYTGGYLKALLDVRNFFEGHSVVLKVNRLYNQKRRGAGVKCIDRESR